MTDPAPILQAPKPPSLLPVLSSRMWTLSALIGLACLTAGLSTMILPTQMAVTAGLAVLFIGLWGAALMPEYWTALAFFLLVMVLQLAPAPVVFSGFQSSTFWLLFSGIILGAAIRYTGLGKRAASLLSAMVGKRYPGIISGITFFSLGLAFVMPSSMGRIVLLIPIIVALADHLGYDSGRKGRIGMLVAVAFGTWLPAFSILPSNTPNMMLSGMAESLHGYHLTYWSYLLLHFPVLGALKSLVLIGLILWMFPDRDPVNTTPATFDAKPLTSQERRLMGVLSLCLAFWLTDGIHHISPGWIGLAAALYCLWPQSGLTSSKCINEEVNYGTLFFVAGIIGFGAVLSDTGLGGAVVDGLSGYAGFSKDQPLWNVTALVGISTLVAMITNLPGIPAVMTPIADHLSTLTGLPLETVLMTQVLAFSNAFLPYQAPPLISAMQIGKIPFGAVSRLCLALFMVGLLVLLPLDLLWWHFLGVI